MNNPSQQTSHIPAWKKAIYTNAPLRMYDTVNVGGVIVDISDDRFRIYAVPEITALDEGSFRDYVNILKLGETRHFKTKGESSAIIFLNETLKSMAKVMLENRRLVIDYASILKPLGFEENYVQRNDVKKPNEKVLKQAFVYVAKRE